MSETNPFSGKIFGELSELFPEEAERFDEVARSLPEDATFDDLMRAADQLAEVGEDDE